MQKHLPAHTYVYKHTHTHTHRHTPCYSRRPRCRPQHPVQCARERDIHIHAYVYKHTHTHTQTHTHRHTPCYSRRPRFRPQHMYTNTHIHTHTDTRPATHGVHVSVHSIQCSAHESGPFTRRGGQHACLLFRAPTGRQTTALACP